MKCSAILIGDNRLFLEGLALLLKSHGLSITHAPNFSPELLAISANEQPDLIIWTGSTILEHDIAQWAEIHREFPKLGIVALVEEIDAETGNRALAAGVRGILPKCISATALSLSLQLIALGENVSTVPAILARGRQLTPAFPRSMETSISSSIKLSSRETEILQRLKAGSPNKVIANELGLAEATVKVHLKALLRKLNVSNRTQAAIWSLSHSLMP